MYTIRIPRPDVTTDEVVQALRSGLGPSYNVLPGMRQTRAPYSAPVAGSPDTIVVGIGANRVQRAQVTVVHRSGATELRISPGGLISDLVLNALVIARTVRRVLANAAELRPPS